MLDIGRAALQRPEAKPYVHDLLLSMALAEVREVTRRMEIFIIFFSSLVIRPFLI